MEFEQLKDNNEESLESRLRKTIKLKVNEMEKRFSDESIQCALIDAKPKEVIVEKIVDKVVHVQVERKKPQMKTEEI